MRCPWTRGRLRPTPSRPGLGCIFSFMSWDKLREWLQTAGLVAIPVMVTIMGNKVAESNATRETNAEYVRMAIDVLAHDSTHADRVWAAKVLARYSDVPFSAGA